MIKIHTMFTDNNITVNFSGKTKTFHSGTTEYDQILLAIKENRKQDIPNIVSTAEKIVTYTKGEFQVRSGIIYLDEQPVPTRLSTKILKFKDSGLPYTPLVNFARKVQKNPSYRAVNALFDFLETNNHPITDDGNFIAYKYVNTQYRDSHTNTMDNSIGATVTMPRNQVNEDPTQTCSHGLHVASYEYAHTTYGLGKSDTGDGHVIELEVDPSDVVAVPIDYNNGKMRVCRYVVVADSTGPLPGDLKGYVAPSNDTEEELPSSDLTPPWCYDCQEYHFEDEECESLYDDRCSNCGSADHYSEDCDE